MFDDVCVGPHWTRKWTCKTCTKSHVYYPMQSEIMNPIETAFHKQSVLQRVYVADFDFCRQAIHFCRSHLVSNHKASDTLIADAWPKWHRIQYAGLSHPRSPCDKFCSSLRTYPFSKLYSIKLHLTSVAPNSLLTAMAFIRSLFQQAHQYRSVPE